MNAEITVSDYLESVRADIRPRPIFAALGIGLIVLGGVVFFALLFDLGTEKKKDANPFLYGCVYFGVLASIAWWHWIYVPGRVRRVFQQHRALHEPFRMEVGDDGLYFESALGTGVLPWSHIYRWRQTPNLILIEHSDALRNILPKRDFASPEALEEFEATLLNRVGPENHARPTGPDASDSSGG